MKTKNKYIFIGILSPILILIDIITKILCEGINQESIPNFFYLISTHNYGAGLGVLSGKTALLIILSLIFLLAFCLYDFFCKKNGKVYNLSLSFIIAGAIGNLIDRIFLGYVRDFLFVNIKIMPYYFNIADVLLTVGIILFVIDLLFLTKNSKAKNPENALETTQNHASTNSLQKEENEQTLGKNLTDKAKEDDKALNDKIQLEYNKNNNK